MRDFGRDLAQGDKHRFQDQVLATMVTYVGNYGEANGEHYNVLVAELGNVLGALDYAAERQK